MMRDMAVDQPLARLLRLPDSIVALARPDIDGVGKEACGGGNRLAVAGDDLERPATDMHRVDESVVGTIELRGEIIPR